MRIVPVNFAETGPTFAATTARHSLSPMRSSDSHPGMDACNIAGSLSAAHTAAGDAGITRLLVISMDS